MVNEIRKVRPEAKLVYNNSPSFNWTLKFREQVYNDWKAAGKDVSAYPDPALDSKAMMDVAIDGTELSDEAGPTGANFSGRDAAREAGIFHHLITLPTYHTAALSTDVLSQGYFGDLGIARLCARRSACGNSARSCVCETPGSGRFEHR